ncbi:glutathione S-transferase family protein [Sphingobium sp.]|uniref:glutathione S-transferase family protein n=1 Tax=Sphingobium sp. TaxID=1912891 RepID=UPI0035C6CB1A
MMKLFIGNKAYSSWSLRGWLACKLSGLPFEEVVVPLYDEAWEKRREGDEFAPSSGKVPILWDGEDVVVWDSLAIVEYLNEKSGGDKFWPADIAARAMARSMAAEMHSSFAALRREHSMNIRQIYAPVPPSEAVAQDISRIMQLWAQARARYGGEGEFLFGEFSAVDVMFAPVVTRFITYQLPVARFADAYMRAVINHVWMQEWIGGAQAEEWVIDRFEGQPQSV